MRSSSDLIANIDNLQLIHVIECLTVVDGQQAEHTVDIISSTITSDEPENADPVFCAIVSMLPHV